MSMSLDEVAQEAKRNRKTLSAVGERLTYFNRVKQETVITHGFTEGDLIYIPKNDFHLTDWMLVHKPSGYLLHSFNQQDFRLGLCVLRLAGTWNWKGSDPKGVSRETHLKWRSLFDELELHIPAYESTSKQRHRRASGRG